MVSTHTDHKKQSNSHPNFVTYVKKIRNHKNYHDMPEIKTSNWVTMSNGTLGKKRKEWMRTKMKKFGIKDERGCFQKAALKLHPFKKKPCKICGNELYLEYVYPNKRFIQYLKKNNIIVNDITHINVVLDRIKNKPKLLKQFKKDFNIYSDNDYDIICELQNQNKYLSPGAMSNFPDRLDGYHTYNKCCRDTEDRGRNPTNLRTYNEDRRAYEFWSDGDWKAADDVMACLRQNNISPDHIGPISLGFCHRPTFNEMTLKQNIAKRNTLRMSDICKLLSDEKIEQVVSWHTKFIWDLLKNKPCDDESAEKLGKLLRGHLHHVFYILYQIKNDNHISFLETYMNLQYSYYKNTIVYNSITKKITIKKKFVDNTKHKLIRERRKRKMLNALENYNKKVNRNQNYWYNLELDIQYINESITISIPEGKKKLDAVLKKLALLAVKKYS